MINSGQDPGKEQNPEVVNPMFTVALAWGKFCILRSRQKADLDSLWS